MRILLLTHSFNSLAQRVYCELAELGHELSIEFDIGDEVSLDAVALFAPDLIVAPFLKRAIPESIWAKHVCLVVHPGIVGDRGPSAQEPLRCSSGVLFVLHAQLQRAKADLLPRGARQQHLTGRRRRRQAVDGHPGIMRFGRPAATWDARSDPNPSIMESDVGVSNQTGHEPVNRAEDPPAGFSERLERHGLWWILLVSATAMGGMVTIREAAKLLDLPLRGATCAIQGYGNVGGFAHRLAHDLFGLKVVAVSDEFGGIYCEGGLDPEVVSAHMRRNGKVGGCPGSEAIGNAELLELPVDILIPAAIENQLTAANADRIRARIVAELANGPTTPEADQVLTEKGVYIIPDFLCNAGGVTVSYFEQVQNAYNYYWTEDEVHQRLDQKMTKAFYSVHEMAQRKDVHNRLAAYLVAVDRVAKAMKLRGWV